MSIFNGKDRTPETPKPTPSDPHDLSITDALIAANRDYARLRQIHTLDWQFDITGTVRFVCGCDQKARTSSQMDQHILKEVRIARGPVKSK